MAIKKVQMHTVVCDNCKLDIGINQEYSCWNDANFAEENAINSDWLIHDGKHYCLDCYDYDENDNLVIDKKRTNLFLT